MKLTLTVGAASAHLEGTYVEVMAILPELGQLLGLGVTETPFRDLEGWEQAYADECDAFAKTPEDWHHTSTTDPLGYATLVRQNTGRHVETIWPPQLNNPENLPRGKRSVVF